jgi:DMSO/TMAO reductase YedYZ molybdopterin-dependent catalytic subunit
MLALATGFGGLINGSERGRWVLWLHGISGYAVMVVLFWKGGIIYAVFKRRWSLSLTRLALLVLTVMLLLILATGLIWTLGGRRLLGGFSLMTIHTLLSIGLTMILVWHVVARQFILHVPEARDRRALLRLGGASLAGLALWGGAESMKAALKLPGAARRFTGSYETGSLTGVFPATSWLLDDPTPVDPQQWRLVVEGAVERPLVLSYDELAQLAPATVKETIDCTGGWYSTQEWSGIPVARLLEMTGVTVHARSVTVEAVTGYDRRFSVAEAREYVLATHVAGQVLSHGHGFPLRLVAAGHRGFEWVKWVTHLRVNETSKLWQPPVPMQ